MDTLILLVIAVILGIIAVGMLGPVLNILWALIIGAIVGAIANWVVSFFMAGGGPRGILAAALAGITGSFLATLIVGAHGLGWTFLGAVIVVVLWKLLTASRYPARAV